MGLKIVGAQSEISLGYLNIDFNSISVDRIFLKKVAIKNRDKMIIKKTLSLKVAVTILPKNQYSCVSLVGESSQLLGIEKPKK